MAFDRAKEQSRYAQRRSDAYGALTAEISASLGKKVSLESASRKAMLAWGIQWTPHQHEGMLGGWDWEKLLEPYFRSPSAFHLAVWCEETLCGLAAGGPSDSHNSLSIDYLEGSPDPRHPLRGMVLGIVISAAERYGTVLGASLLRVKNPDVGLIGRYRVMGFELVPFLKGVQYCERRI